MISFEFDSGGPSRIEAWIPAVSSSGVVSVWQPQNDAQGMEYKIECKDYDNMLYLVNKTPKWDEAHGGHVLNFQVLFSQYLQLILILILLLLCDVGPCYRVQCEKLSIVLSRTGGSR